MIRGLGNPQSRVVARPTGYLLRYFDVSPRDCVVTIDEVSRNSLVISPLSPDMKIDGVPMISFGFGFEAVPASF